MGFLRDPGTLKRLRLPLALRASRSYAGRSPSEPATASRAFLALPLQVQGQSPWRTPPLAHENFIKKAAIRLTGKQTGVYNAFCACLCTSPVQTSKAARSPDQAEGDAETVCPLRQPLYFFSHS